MIKRMKNDIIRETNDIARAQIVPVANSVWEERVIAQVTAFNRALDKEFPETAFMIGQLIRGQKTSATKYRKIELACEQLIRSYFKIKKGHNFELYPIFAFIKFQDGIIEAQLNPSLKPYYLELKSLYSLRSLPEFCKLSSVYSQQIFRFLNSWSGLPEATIPLKELHLLTTAPDSLKQNFKDFRKRVLEISHKEINEKTGLRYNWEAVKVGRKVTAIRFIFRLQKSDIEEPGEEAYVDKINSAIRQVADGRSVTKTMAELEAMAAE